MNPKTTKRIDELYARLPKIECRGLCQLSCGPIGMTEGERKRIVEQTGEDPEYNIDHKACGLLDDRGKCSVYDIRPMICRLFGLSLAMQCPFGCVPEHWLNSGEGKALLAEMDRIAGKHKPQYMTADPQIVVNIITIERIRTKRDNITTSE